MTVFLEMGKVCDPSPRKRGKVEALLKLKTLSQREIAKSVGMSQKGVHTIKKRLHSGLTSSPQRTKSGRKPIVTQRVRRILLMECKKNRKMTSKQLQGSLQHHNIHISTSCVRCQLIQAWFVAQRPRRKPLLNNKQQAKRLQWAKEHKHWTSADWRKVNVCWVHMYLVIVTTNSHFSVSLCNDSIIIPTVL